MILTPITQHGGSILLHDHHGEYTGGLSGTSYDDGKWCRAQVIWDGFTLSTVRTDLGLSDDDSAIDAAFRTIYANTLDTFLADNCAEPSRATIWEISGEGMIRAFTHLLHALDTIPSGDDDVFDYWPNTMDMVWEFACDLDSMHATTEHRALVHDMAKRIHAAFIAEDPTNGEPFTDWDGEFWMTWEGE